MKVSVTLQLSLLSDTSREEGDLQLNRPREKAHMMLQLAERFNT